MNTRFEWFYCFLTIAKKKTSFSLFIFYLSHGAKKHFNLHQNIHNKVTKKTRLLKLFANDTAQTIDNRHGHQNNNKNSKNLRVI